MTRRDFVNTIGVAGTTLLARQAVQAADKKTITLALLGVAHMHTPMFLKILKTRDDVKVAYVWDHDAARAGKCAAECGAKTAASVAEVLADSSVSGVVILSETSLHAELATAAAKAGKHVFVEKPIGACVKDAAQIAAAVEKAGVLFTTGYHLRTHPQVHLRQAEHREGQPRQDRPRTLLVLQRLRAPGRRSIEELKWTVDPRWGALGGFADTGTHALDMLMWLLGDVEP